MYDAEKKKNCGHLKRNVNITFKCHGVSNLYFENAAMLLGFNEILVNRYICSEIF